MSNFNTLADRYAILKDEIASLTKELDAVKAEILASGVAEIVGQIATVTVSLRDTSSFDSKAAKALLTDAQIADCTKVRKNEAFVTYKTHAKKVLVKIDNV